MTECPCCGCALSDVPESIERLQRDLETAQAALTKAGKDKSDSEEQIATRQRENTELQQSSDFWKAETIGQNTTISTLRAKLAAAEAALKLARPEIEYKRTHGQTTQARKSARRAVDAVDAAIDAAKTVVKS